MKSLKAVYLGDDYVQDKIM